MLMSADEDCCENDANTDQTVLPGGGRWRRETQWDHWMKGGQMAAIRTFPRRSPIIVIVVIKYSVVTMLFGDYENKDKIR